MKKTYKEICHVNIDQIYIYKRFFVYVPPPAIEGGHIGFGVDPVGVCVALFQCVIF